MRELVATHVWMGHITHMQKLFRAFECIILQTRICLIDICLYLYTTELLAPTHVATVLGEPGRQTIKVEARPLRPSDWESMTDDGSGMHAHAHTHTHTHTYTHTHTRAHTHTFTITHTRIHIHTHIHTHVHTHTHIHTLEHMQMHSRQSNACACVQVCVCVKMGVSTLVIQCPQTVALIYKCQKGIQYTDSDLRFSVLIKMFVTTISFVSFHLGPSNQWPSGPIRGWNSQGSNCGTHSLMSQSRQQSKWVSCERYLVFKGPFERMCMRHVLYGTRVE